MQVVPLGENCHLGAALSAYGNFASSLFRWASVQPLDILDLLASEFRGLRRDGRVRFRVPSDRMPGDAAPPGGGGFQEIGMFRGLGLPDDQQINTAMFYPSGWFVHGVRTTFAELARTDAAGFAEENLRKLDHLAGRFMESVSGGREYLAIRVESRPTPDLFEQMAKLSECLRSFGAGSGGKFLLALPQGFAGPVDALTQRGIEVCFHPPVDAGNPMLISKQSRRFWDEEFASHDLPRSGAPGAYVFMDEEATA